MNHNLAKRKFQACRIQMQLKTVLAVMLAIVLQVQVTLSLSYESVTTCQLACRSIPYCNSPIWFFSLEQEYG
jgi:hypothetical protein